MQFLAHRGLWEDPEHKNSRHALRRAFAAGLGVETDIRDLDGELVISHDMPRRGALPLRTMLNEYVTAGRPGTLALNIKSDGLTETLRQLLDVYAVTDYFCFDMSVPDTLPYLKAGLSVAARVSEYEPEGLLTTVTSSLWVDYFQEAQLSSTRLADWLIEERNVCLVSPELHGRKPDSFWQQLNLLPPALKHHKNLMLCTDYPLQAKEALA